MINTVNMTFRDYIENRYDVRDRIEQQRGSAVLDFINSDIFPYDFITTDNGEMVKMLYYAEGDKEISVLDLLSYTEEDLDKMKGQEDLKELYETYTSQFDFEGSIGLEKIKEIREEAVRRNKELNL